MADGRPVTIDGVDYPSVSAAARALGVHKTTLYMRQYRTGTMDSKGYRVPCVIAGQQFPSIAAAAKVLGLTSSGVVWHLNNPGSSFRVLKYIRYAKLMDGTRTAKEIGAILGINDISVRQYARRHGLPIKRDMAGRKSRKKFVVRKAA
jgi:hypothetical protein